jgi:Uma2 family endonuclease
MSVAMEDFPRRHRITVDEYHHMGQVGLIAPDARVELIEGVIVDMPPIGIPHMAAVNRLNSLLVHAVEGRAIVQCQGSIRLGNFSEPQPDFALLAPREDFYEHQHRMAADTLLAIEVSDSSLKYDTGAKMSLYARHGIPEFWVIDIGGRKLLTFRKPAGAAYEEVRATALPGIVRIMLLPDVPIDLSSLYR